MVNGKAEIEFDGEIEQFTVHHVLCFDPIRRRMSVIVEDQRGRYFLLKGYPKPHRSKSLLVLETDFVLNIPQT